MTVKIRVGDCRKLMARMDAGSIHCVVTSPPYWRMRDYGTPPLSWADGWRGSLGLEPTLEMYVGHLLEVFPHVKRVLRKDGTLWLNLGGCYHRKQLQGMPWRVALALQADGWWLRSDIIWHKPKVMPESVTDRPTKSHEYVFLLSKSKIYHYDHEAVKEPAIHAGSVVKATNPDTAKNAQKGKYGQTAIGFTRHDTVIGEGRNRRTVWTISPRNFKGAHFAVFPDKLVEPCIKAGCPVGGTVLDPFAGSGTVGVVANRLGRNATLLELSVKYAIMARKRVVAAR